MKVRLTLMGRGYDRTSSLPSEVDVTLGACLGDVLHLIQSHYGELVPLSTSWLVVVNGQHLGTVERYEDVELRERDDLMLIAPVAGG